MTNKKSIRNIDPDVLWDAKIYAAQTRQTMGEVVTEAIERLIYEESVGRCGEDDGQHHRSDEAPPEASKIGAN